jgi:hypothetical protein
VNEQTEWNLKLRAQVFERDAEITRLMKLLDEQTGWNLQLNTQLGEQNAGVDV